MFHMGLGKWQAHNLYLTNLDYKAYKRNSFHFFIYVLSIFLTMMVVLMSHSQYF